MGANFLRFRLLSFHSLALANLETTVKLEYLKALEVVPHLVEGESDRLKFLQTEDFDPVKAARRLCLYWKYRRVIFGDRWLLPCIQTGTGCLRRDAIDLIRCGFVRLTSKPSERPVVLIDATRRRGPTPDNTVAAIAYYFATTIADEKFQSEGVILFQLIETNGYWNTDPAPTGYWGIIDRALPMKIRSIVMVPSFAAPDRNNALEYLSYQASRLVESRSKRKTEIVAHGLLDETLRRLESFGISRTNLPPCLGGTYTNDHLHDWIRSRLTIEDAMSAASPVLNHIHARRGSSWTMIRQRQSGDTSAPVFQSEEEKKIFIRQRNALYARRKYYRNKIDMIAIPEQSQSLRDRNAVLRADNERLAKLLARAQVVVEAHLSTLDQED